MNAEIPPPPEASEPTKKYLAWIDSLADRLASTGLSWARQSLSMGKRVLETSAKTLSQTAGSLDEMEKKLERTRSVNGSGPPPA
jgi:hypothetical protein